jgi:hypothetical protein
MVVSRVNPNMIHQIFMDGVVGLPGLESHDVHGENPERMPV